MLKRVSVQTESRATGVHNQQDRLACGRKHESSKITSPVQRAATEMAHVSPARKHGSACVEHKVISVETELLTGIGGACEPTVKEN